MSKLKRTLTLAGIYLLMVVPGLTTTAYAANKLENVAHAFVTVVKIAVFGVFGWKAAEMAFKERYGLAWGLGLAAALVGGFLFGGEAVFTWLWNIIQDVINGA